MKNDEVLESRGFSSLQLRPLQRWPLHDPGRIHVLR